MLFDDPTALTEDGYHRWHHDSRKDLLLDGDVVCFESRPNDSAAFRTAVQVADDPPCYVLPCNTLVRLVKVEGPPFFATYRRWVTRPMEDGAGVIYDDRKEGISWRPIGEGRYFNDEHTMYKAVKPGVLMAENRKLGKLGYDERETFTKSVNQRLLTCTVTYVLPTGVAGDGGSGGLATAVDAASEAAMASKFGDGVVTLTFLDRQAYTRGTDELTRDLSHKMEDEWKRADNTWSDWKGVSYTGQECWEYVNSPATEADGTPGRRDVKNVGVSPDDFLKIAHDHISRRLGAAGGGGGLPPAHALVVMEEVLAVRMYTGAAYQPINTWLRAVAKLPADERRAAALDAGSSFGATVGHLISAIRKLAAASTAQEAARTLYRGLKGVLPASFYLPDAAGSVTRATPALSSPHPGPARTFCSHRLSAPQAGVVCATDAAFMSTSLGIETPIHYMADAPKPNLLWEIAAAAEDDMGYHVGAEVSLLSQYEGEREVCLFLFRVDPAHSCMHACVTRAPPLPGALPAAHHAACLAARRRTCRGGAAARRVAARACGSVARAPGRDAPDRPREREGVREGPRRRHLHRLSAGRGVALTCMPLEADRSALPQHTAGRARIGMGRAHTSRIGTFWDVTTR